MLKVYTYWVNNCLCLEDDDYKIVIIEESQELAHELIKQLAQGRDFRIKEMAAGGREITKGAVL